MVKMPKLFVFCISILFILLFTIGCSKTGSPTVPATESVPTQTEPSSTPIPSKTAIPTHTPSPTETPVATFTPIPSATATTRSDDTNEISPADLYTNPENFVGKNLMFKGILLAYGFKQIDGKQVYALQVGVKEFPHPILVLGFEPSSRLATRDGVIIGGTGGGVYTGLFPDEPNEVTPVIHGVWYECNMPLDQMEYPRDYWVTIP